MNQPTTPPHHPEHRAVGDQAADDAVDTELVDLSHLPLSTLRTLSHLHDTSDMGDMGDSVLAHSLRRVVEEAGSADSVVAGYSQSV